MSSLTTLAPFCDECFFFFETKENIASEKTNMEFIVLTTPLDSSLSCMLI